MQNRVEVIVGIFVLAALAVLAYMGFQIGAFRFDRMRYNQYEMLFKDVSGLGRKALVKIAGVNVGWVEDVTGVCDGFTEVKVTVMIHRDYILHTNAYAIIRQDGLLGPKYLEVIPGDPLLPRLEPGGTLSKPSIEPVSIDELLQQVQRISTNIEEVTQSFKAAVGGPEGSERLKEMVRNLSIASESIASFSEKIDRSISRNEEHIDSILKIGDNFQRLTDRLDTDVFPTFQESIHKISQVFDRDFNRVATKLESSIDALEDASLQARDGFRSIGAVAEKIDEGKGLIGKLINEDETYRDLRTAVQGLKNYFARVDMLQIVFDSHVEGMYRPAENYSFEDSKGYFDVRIHPNEDHFYLIELATSEKGLRFQREREYEFACHDRLVDPSSLDIPDYGRLRWEYKQNRTKYIRNTMRFGVQFGKIYQNFALRFGLFDGYFAGVGVDIDIPFETDKFRWLMTFEGYDWRGWNRKDDRRPHLKWLNRVYLLRNLYLVFGADDFISRWNANIFFGAGIRFSDDDVKYFLPSIGSAQAFNA